MRLHFWLALALITSVSWFTHMRGYGEPHSVFWDENYHIASAQKYLSGVFFMEPHPPLGKLLIAAGQRLHAPASVEDSKFIDTDYATGFPDGFDFRGYRLIPTLLGWLSVPLFFLCLYSLMGSAWGAAALTLPYLFQNLFIVQFRAAMLDSVMMFFFLGCALAAIRLRSNPKSSRSAFGFGICFGLLIATKVLGLIALALLLPWLWSQKQKALPGLFKIGGAAFLCWALVWQIHIARGLKVNPMLQNAGYYLASGKTKVHLEFGERYGIRVFFDHVKDAIAYFANYQLGVPKLDLCKPDENGSPPWLWPLGGRSINYRWDKPGDGTTKILYLQANPIAWWLSLIGVLWTLWRLVFVRRWSDLNRRALAATLVLLWIAYYAELMRIPRVMYLYHAIIPTVVGLLTLGIAWFEGSRSRIWTLVFGMAIVLEFWVYAPFTYYWPLSNSEIQTRAFLPLFDLHCVDCPREKLFLKGCPGG